MVYDVFLDGSFSTMSRTSTELLTPLDHCHANKGTAFSSTSICERWKTRGKVPGGAQPRETPPRRSPGAGCLWVISDNDECLRLRGMYTPTAFVFGVYLYKSRGQCSIISLVSHASCETYTWLQMMQTLVLRVKSPRINKSRVQSTNCCLEGFKRWSSCHAPMATVTLLWG